MGVEVFENAFEMLWQVGIVHTNYKELGHRVSGKVIGSCVCLLIRILCYCLADLHCHRVGVTCPCTAHMCGCAWV